MTINVLNWIMFIVIMISICKHSRSLSAIKDKTKAEKTREIKNNFIIAMSLAVVLGLGWTLGLLATSFPSVEVTTTFQVLFSIFVGMQGVLIFGLHALRNSDARNVWKQWFALIGRKSHLKFLVSSNTTGSTGTAAHQYVATSSIGLTTLPRSTLPRNEKKADLSKITDCSRDKDAATFVSETSTVTVQDHSRLEMPRVDECEKVDLGQTYVNVSGPSCDVQYQTPRPIIRQGDASNDNEHVYDVAEFSREEYVDENVYDSVQ